MKVGVDIEAQDGMTWNRWRELAYCIEALGYESLWRSDHLFSVVGRVERPALEAWASLAYLATATNHIRFGTLVTPVTFRHPSLFALTTAAVDEMSGGRLEVGLGAGWEEREHKAFGVSFPPTANRFDLLEESIAVLKLLWTGEEVSYSGNFYSLHGARGHPRPIQRPHPPIVIGGTGEKRTLRIVARHADEWNAHGVTLEVFRAKRAILEQHCQEIERDPRSIRHSIAGPCIIGETKSAIREGIASFAHFFPLHTPAFFPQGAHTDNSVEAVRARGWFAGSSDEIVEQIQGFAAEGVHRVMIQLMPQDQASLELFAQSVLPRVA